MIRIKEAIVVEGRYDVNTVKQLVDAPVIETRGFGIFRDDERLELLRRLAQSRGLVVLTDSDGAGFVIRNYLRGAMDPALVKHAYIPEIMGKEKRKRTASKEGKLGVEGMGKQVLLRSLARAGVCVLGSEEEVSSLPSCRPITKADFFEWGLSGGPGSRERRLAVLQALSLPSGLSPNAMIEVCNALYDRETMRKICRQIVADHTQKKGQPVEEK